MMAPSTYPRFRDPGGLFGTRLVWCSIGAVLFVMVCCSGAARRYGTPMTSWRPPASQARQDELAIAYARDGYALLEAVYQASSPGWLRELPAVGVLRVVLLQNYTRTITEDGREVIRRRDTRIFRTDKQVQTGRRTVRKLRRVAAIMAVPPVGDGAASPRPPGPPTARPRPHFLRV